jgi:ABC-2 type transport system permease protein
VASLIPFFTPILMLLRVTIAPGAPVWQVLLGLLLSGSTAFVCLAVSAKVFRVGMLAQGSTPRLSDLWRWLRQG